MLNYDGECSHDTTLSLDASFLPSGKIDRRIIFFRHLCRGGGGNEVTESAEGLDAAELCGAWTSVVNMGILVGPTYLVSLPFEINVAAAASD